MTFSVLGVPATSVLVPANSTAAVDVTVTPNAGLASKSLFGGYVVLTPQGGGLTHRVPYAGFKGDYQSIQVLAPTVNNFPWLAKFNGTSFINQPGGASYSMVGNDVPFVVLHLDHQVRRLRVTVEDASTGASWHRAIETEYLGRNSGAATFFSFSWDGQTVAGKKTYTVPNGTYVLKLSVLKALGDPANPAHWETWPSPAVTVARP
jgi:minor extracellular serine protease Vpr